MSFEKAYLELISGWHACAPLREIKSRYIQADEAPVILYGMGRLGRVIMDACDELRIPVAGLCDRNTGVTYCGYRIIFPDKLKHEFPQALVIVGSRIHNDEICGTLCELGFSSDRIVPAPVRYPTFESPKSFSRHKSGYSWAYDFFEDARSKKLVLDRMSLCLLDQGILMNSGSAQYYEDG